jgi:hypothetical protein
MHVSVVSWGDQSIRYGHSIEEKERKKNERKEEGENE